MLTTYCRKAPLLRQIVLSADYRKDKLLSPRPFLSLQVYHVAYLQSVSSALLPPLVYNGVLSHSARLLCRCYVPSDLS